MLQFKLQRCSAWLDDKYRKVIIENAKRHWKSQKTPKTGSRWNDEAEDGLLKTLD